MKKIVVGLALAGALLAGACSSDADVASENLAREAEEFKINRRIVFVNGITDKYLLLVEGYCSIDDQGDQLEVTCKVGDDKFKKHHLGEADNVFYISEQIEAAEVSTDHYKVVFKPETIVPDIDR